MEENPQETKDSVRATRLSGGLAITIVVLVLVLGVASGAAGSYFVYRFATTSGVNTGLVNQNPAALSGSGSVVDVVAKASPAVVSIVVSENVNDQNSPTADSFGNNPNQFFTSPFGFGEPNMPAPTPTSTAPDFEPVAAGSGFFITSDGMILTNKHVVSDATAQYAVYTSDGTKYTATVLSRDPLNDIALLKVSIKNAPTLSLANSTQVQIGQQVIAIGNSLGEYSNTVTTGVVSGIDRTVTAGDEGSSETLEDVIQTDAAINPGNSGGPLLNATGQVIGMNTAIDEQGQLVGFAIPSNDASRDIQLYQKYGTIEKPFLGVQYVLLDPEIAQQNNLPVSYGAWLNDTSGDGGSAIVAGSAADKAGLKDGDIITSVNGTALDASTTLESLVENMNPGDVVTFGVLRGKSKLSTKVTLGEKSGG